MSDFTDRAVALQIALDTGNETDAVANARWLVDFLEGTVFDLEDALRSLEDPPDAEAPADERIDPLTYQFGLFCEALTPDAVHVYTGFSGTKWAAILSSPRNEDGGRYAIIKAPVLQVEP